ncbi:MAG: cytochrome bc complex cytochrome b subunit [Candidatus Caenarcaniphilales bacterium]|nr:cytochrome bc complex cytochrome b subunit [Candidatus Caenarcaniphilales bacterium]
MSNTETKKENTAWQTVQKELDERLKISEIAEMASHKTVPIHKHSFWYYFGGISLFFFIIQMITGMLLLMHYEPGVATSYASVQKLLTKVEFGQIMRSLHSWAANMMVACVLIHMFSAYFMKAYQKPRELTWISGAILLFLTITLGFTGYLLPWDDIAYFATKVGLDIAETSPITETAWKDIATTLGNITNNDPKLIMESIKWPGIIAADILRGGADLTNLTIQRFASIHYVILPWVFSAVLGLHILLIQLHGNTIPKKIEEKKEYRNIPFFPNFFYEDLFAWLLTLNVLAVVAIIFPWGLGPEADPLAPAPAGIHPEWYFMAPFELLKWMPPSLGFINGEFIGVALFGGASVLLFAVPFWDPKEDYSLFGLKICSGKTARIATYYGIFALLGLLFFTGLAYWCLDGKDVCVRMHDFFPWMVRGFK